MNFLKRLLICLTLITANYSFADDSNENCETSQGSNSETCLASDKQAAVITLQVSISTPPKELVLIDFSEIIKDDVVNRPLSSAEIANMKNSIVNLIGNFGAAGNFSDHLGYSTLSSHTNSYSANLAASILSGYDQSALISSLWSLTDFGLATGQMELARRSNYLLGQMSPKSAEFFELNFGVPGMDSSIMGLDEGFAMDSTPFRTGKFTFSSNLVAIDANFLLEGDPDFSQGFEDGMSELGFAFPNKNKDTPRAQWVSENPNRTETRGNKFTTWDRVSSGLAVGAAGALAGGSAGLSFGATLGPKITLALGALGAGVGGTAGFIEGYDRPVDKYASGTTHETTYAFEFDSENNRATTTTTETVKNWSTGNTDTTIRKSIEKHKPVEVKSTEKIISPPPCVENCPPKADPIACLDRDAKPKKVKHSREVILSKIQQVKDSLSLYLADLTKRPNRTLTAEDIISRVEIITNWGENGRPAIRNNLPDDIKDINLMIKERQAINTTWIGPMKNIQIYQPTPISR